MNNTQFEYGMGLCEVETIVVCQEIVDPLNQVCGWRKTEVKVNHVHSYIHTHNRLSVEYQYARYVYKLLLEMRHNRQEVIILEIIQLSINARLVMMRE